MRRALLSRMTVIVTVAAGLLLLPSLSRAQDFFSEGAPVARPKAKPKAKVTAKTTATAAKPAPKIASKKTVASPAIKEVTEAVYVTKNGDNRNLWNTGMGPMVPHTKFPRNCAICHVAKRWDILRADFHFDHLKETGYALVGAHASVSCLRCHNDRVLLTAQNGQLRLVVPAEPKAVKTGT